MELQKTLSIDGSFNFFNEFCRHVAFMNGLPPTTQKSVDAFNSTKSWISSGIRKLKIHRWTQLVECS